MDVYTTGKKRAVLTAIQLRRRMVLVSWWRGVMTLHPGGVVPVAVAREVLGVSKQRLTKLIATGRLPVIGPMPDCDPRHRFIPVDALYMAPSMMESGRRPGNTRARPSAPVPNPWYELVGGPQSLENLPKIGDGTQIVTKPASDLSL